MALVEEKGWPKNTEVGGKAASAAFLIIQHSDAQKQKKYLPMIEQLCKEKEASWQSYALMYDRIQTSDNLPQKYGSQVKYNTTTKKYELLPLLDETKVDEWRKEIGMQPLATYLANWDIKYEVKKKWTKGCGLEAVSANINSVLGAGWIADYELRSSK